MQVLNLKLALASERLILGLQGFQHLLVDVDHSKVGGHNSLLPTTSLNFHFLSCLYPIAMHANYRPLPFFSSYHLDQLSMYHSSTAHHLLVKLRTWIRHLFARK